MMAATGPLHMRGGTSMEQRARKLNEREALLAAAALHRMIAQAFSNPEAGSLKAVRCTALDLVDAALRGLLPSALLPTLRALLRAWRTTSTDELTAEYSRLFLGSGLVPLREGGYGGGSRFAGQPVDIADLNGFYLAFGFAPPPTAPNPPDHLGTELEYLSLLHLKKAFALQRGRVSQAKIVERAMAHFLEDHLGRWTAALDMALREAKAAAPYVLMAELLRKAVAAECASLRIRPRATARNPVRTPLSEDTFVCPFVAGEPDSGRYG